MLIIENEFNAVIDRKIIKENEENEHTPSGKLSASSLGQPLQWQVLKYLAVKNDCLKMPEYDAYTLRKFKRGKDVESRILDYFDCDKQIDCEYRDCVGVIDAIIDTKEFDFDFGEIPFEIKSVTSLKFKYINKSNKFQEEHALQGCLYALATGKEKFGLVYVNADDYRCKVFILDVADFKHIVDAVIDRYNYAIENKIIPVFEPIADWQKDPKYQKFPEFAELTNEQIHEKIESLGIKF